VSKGSRPRPYSVNLNTFNNNWDNIFRKNEVDDDNQPPPGTSRIESSTVDIDVDTEVKDSNQGG
jgi:hypothetical protein